MEFNRAQLKRRVRQAMKGQRPRPMLITLLFTILISIGTQIVNGILRAASGSNAITQMYAQLVIQQERDPLSAIQYMLVYFGPQRLALALAVGFVLAALITALWADFMRTGYSDFCLGMVRGEQPQTSALFSHFPQWGSVLFTKLLAGVFRGLWGLLLGAAGLGFLFVSALPQMDVLLIVGMIVSYLVYSLGYAWVTLRYAMVDFLIVDQGLTGMDAIRESKRLVRENGNTGRLFILELSFIGWHLLEAGIIIACAMPILLSAARMDARGASTVPGIPMEAFGILAGIGLLLVAGLILAVFNLWLTPYINGARALFYDWARGAYNARPSGGFDGGQGGWGQPAGYTRSSGPSSGRGIGPGGQNGAGAPRSPRPPKDDPWN